jgi:hypothetical protein
MKKSKSHIVKMSVNLSSTVIEQLKTLAEERGVTMTHIVGRAIVDAKFFHDALKEGCKILLEDKRGKFRQVIFT